MAWCRLGLVLSPDQIGWAHSHASLPMPVALAGDTIRVFFSTRDHDRRSHVGWADVAISDTPRLLDVSPAPVLSPGEDGAFDDSGVSIGSIVPCEDGLRLYYMGWNLGVRSPWRNAIGIADAASPDAPFQRRFAGPILDRSPHDPYTLSYPCVLRLADDDWRMWYGSNLNAAVGNADMSHVVKQARSQDGVAWHRDGGIAVGFADPSEYAIARPSVVPIGGGYLMTFACRGSNYRIGAASSADGEHWVRCDAKFGLDTAADGWDSAMTCYPALFIQGERLWLAYNGDGYGATGFGLAVWDAALPEMR
jgi:hypothetical protein